MASYSPKLLVKKYDNWVKAQLAVLFTKEGIQPFVCNDLQRFQLKSLSDICYNNGLYSGTLCSSCSTENVVKCPTYHVCNVRRGRCSFHRNVVPAGCPKNICNHFKTEIQNVHRYKGPSYKNTDATLWCSKSWEVAKCFMPPEGYKDSACASETDFNGIISVIINNTDFQSRVQENLTARNNIFEQARAIGRNVRHSASLEVEDHDLIQYFRVLQTLLSDPKYLATDTHAQNAKQKLIDLENDTLVIGKDDIRKALDDVAKAAQDEIRTEIDKQNKHYEMIRMEMIKRKLKDLQSLELKAAEGIKQIENASVKVIGTLINEGRAERETIDELGNKKVEQIKDTSVKVIDTLKNEGRVERKTLIEIGNKNVEQIEDTSVKVIGILKNEGRAERETIAELGNKTREEIEKAAETQLKRIKEKSDREKEEKYIEATERAIHDGNRNEVVTNKIEINNMNLCYVNKQIVTTNSRSKRSKKLKPKRPINVQKLQNESKDTLVDPERFISPLLSINKILLQKLLISTFLDEDWNGNEIFKTGYTSQSAEGQEKIAEESFATGNFIDVRGVKLREYMYVHKELGTWSKSVCQIHFPNGSGTGFRVGSNYILTALHVVKEILKPDYQGKEVKIDFLEDKNVYCIFEHLKRYDPNNRRRYFFKAAVHFKNEETDAAVLELVEHLDGIPFPPAFERFSHPNLSGNFYLIGHEGSIMETNKVEQIIDRSHPRTKNDIKWVIGLNASKTSLNYEYPPYMTLSNENRILFHCQFSKGTSGSPGVLVMEDGSVVVVTMLLCGYPNWRYDDTVDDEFRFEWPANYCIEQGADMTKIGEFMFQENRRLYEDIFRRHLPCPALNN